MVRAKKPPVPRKPKVKRLSLKGWADGWCAKFLEGRLRRYVDALEVGHEEEGRFLKELYREYFYYCPVAVPDHEEPLLPEKAWDSEAVVAAEDLSDEAMASKRERMAVLKKRIRGFLRYRAQKLRRVRASLRHSALDDPYEVLLAKVSGVTKPPKARQPFQQWWTTNKASITQAARAELEATRAALREKNVPENELPVWNVDTHSNYARRTFKAMSKEEQDKWGAAAKAEAAAAKADYQKKMTSPPSQDPKDRAARIENMVTFLAPIIEGLHELTGLHVIVSAAGPMPHRGGEHAVISAASGLNHEAAPVSAPHWRSEPQKMPNGELKAQGYGAWREHLLQWCSTAYTPAEVAAATIPGSKPIEPAVRPPKATPTSVVAESTATIETTEITRSLEAKVDELMALDDFEDDFDDDDFDSEKSDSDDDDGERGRKSRKKQGEGGKKKDAKDKENEELPDDEAYDHTGRRLSEYEIKRNAQIKSNKALLEQLIGDEERPWEKAAREKADKQAETAQKRRQARKRRAEEGPVQPRRQSQRINAGDSSSSPAATSQEQPSLYSDDHAMDIDNSLPGQLEKESTASMAPSASSADAIGQPDDVPMLVDGQPAESNGNLTMLNASQSVENGAHSLMVGVAARPRPTATGAIVSSLSEEMKAAVKAAPDWFRLPYRHFSEAILGKEWRGLIDTFVMLEVRGGFSVASGGVETKKRPQLLSDWQKKGRHSKKDEVLELPLTGITAFEKTYMAWWASMQPNWRTKGETGWTRDEYGNEWGVLTARGVLGWLSIVACLFWWGGAVTRGRKAEERAVWLEAVVDANWMMRGVIEATSDIEG